VQDFIAYVRKVRPGVVEGVRERVPPEILRVLDEALPTGWLSIECSRHWVAEFVRQVGTRDAAELVADFTQHWTLRSPVLKGLAESMIRMNRIRPETVMRMLPRALHMSYRDFFTAKLFELHAHSAVLALEDLAPEVLDTPEYFVLFSGILDGTLRLVRRPGKVELVLDRHHKVARYALTWT
jgi:hypothetical protein